LDLNLTGIASQKMASQKVNFIHFHLSIIISLPCEHSMHIQLTVASIYNPGICHIALLHRAMRGYMPLFDSTIVGPNLAWISWLALGVDIL